MHCRRSPNEPQDVKWDGIEPANINASAEARAVLHYLSELPDQKEKKLISGQFESWGFAVKPLNNPENWLNKIYQATGKWVGIAGIEYHAGQVYISEPNSMSLDHWNNGGLIQLYLIMTNPANPSVSNGGGQCDIKLVLQQGHPYNRHFFNELDEIAEGLMQLKEKKVVVFLNMFAEMTGNWFWWGNQDYETFIQLHKTAFDYLTVNHNLNNLLFIFEPSGQHQSSLSYYPGHDYVDMIGFSIFVDHDVELSASTIPLYVELKDLGKPLAISQWGPRRGKDQVGMDQPPADNYKLLRGVQVYFPDICWWMNWNQAYALVSDENSNYNADLLLDDRWVVNRDELKWRNYLQN